jgi:hypothetical protein
MFYWVISQLSDFVTRSSDFWALTAYPEGVRVPHVENRWSTALEAYLYSFSSYSRTNGKTYGIFVSLWRFRNMVKYFAKQHVYDWLDTSSLHMERICPVHGNSFLFYPSSEVDINQWTQPCMIDLLKARNSALFRIFSCGEIYWFHIQCYTEKCMETKIHIVLQRKHK